MSSMAFHWQVHLCPYCVPAQRSRRRPALQEPEVLGGGLARGRELCRDSEEWWLGSCGRRRPGRRYKRRCGPSSRFTLGTGAVRVIVPCDAVCVTFSQQTEGFEFQASHLDWRGQGGGDRKVGLKGGTSHC